MEQDADLRTSINDLVKEFRRIGILEPDNEYSCGSYNCFCGNHTDNLNQMSENNCIIGDNIHVYGNNIFAYDYRLDIPNWLLDVCKTASLYPTISNKEQRNHCVMGWWQDVGQYRNNDLKTENIKE